MQKTKYSRVYDYILKPIVKIITDPESISIAIEENRKRILDLLTSQDMSVSDLADILKKDISTVYRHMHKLEGAGLVEPAGERRTHHVPEKMYSRTAKVFLFSPEAAKKVEHRFLMDQGQQVARTLLLTLREIGYDVDESDEYRENFARLFIRMNDMTSEGMERISQEGDREISLPMFILLMLTMVILNKDQDPELKRNIERFLGGIKDRKGKKGQ